MSQQGPDGLSSGTQKVGMIDRFIGSLGEHPMPRKDWPDCCPDVKGMTSPAKQHLLHLAFSCIAPQEAYLEIGTYNGKSLLGAALGLSILPPKSPGCVRIHACDNFSEFGESNSRVVLDGNLEKYEIIQQVQFHDKDFRALFSQGIGEKVAAYFYDGAHDYMSQYEGITLVEPLLADEAIVIVDDWRFAEDSQSYAKMGTLNAIKQSTHEWKLLHELDARFNGDLEQWWNGVGVLSFRRNI
jgi:predicted O-methyltransferase YrrM